MGFLSKFEGKMEDAFEGAADRMFDAPISPVQIAKKAEKQMRREKMVGAGKQYAPTLYTVLVNPDDDERLFGYYPTLAGETETYLAAKAADDGLVMDGQPLVRFVVDEDLKHGKFDIIAEAVAAPVIEQLRAEEFERYGISPTSYARGRAGGGQRYASEPYSRGGYGAYGEHDRYDDEYNDGFYSDESPLGDRSCQGIDAAAAASIAGTAGAGAGAAGAGAASTHTVAFSDASANQASFAQGSYARLIDRKTRREHELSSMRMLIGRESTNDIVVRDPNVSRTHAELRLEHGSSWVLTDLGSTNGTFVNGREITAQTLRDGDRIDIGVTSLLFSLS